MSRWQDDVTQEEWINWQAIANRASHGRIRTSLNGTQDLAALVMEKLLKAQSRPQNVEAWIHTVARTTAFDLFRAKSPIHKVDIAEFSESRDLNFSFAVRETLLGPKSAYILQESVEEVLKELSEKHQRLVLMSAAGFSAQEIADELNYASPQAVTNQLRRIRIDLQARLERPSN